MASVYEIPPKKLIDEVASRLENEFKLKMPLWAKFVKTGAHKERPPTQKNWWWIRGASILRTLYVSKQIGVSKLRSKYGGKKRRGHKPPKFYKGSGSVLRKSLQQLEEAGLVKKTKSEGRELTSKGAYLLNESAKSLKNESGRNKKEKTKKTSGKSKQKSSK